MKNEQIPISSPDWNVANPSASFRAFAEAIHEKAKYVFIRDKNHSEMLFFMPLNGQGHIIQSRYKDRDEMAEWMKKHIKDHYIYGLVHICESWLRMAEKKNDNTLRQVIDGEIRVSELREEDRKEALAVAAQARDGWSMTWIDEIVRAKDTGKLSLKPLLKLQDFDGRFGKLFG